MTTRQPSIRPAKGVRRHDDNRYTYLASDGRSGALISVSRDSGDNLVIEVWRADDDVLVRAPYANLDLRPDLMDDATEGGPS